MGRLTQERSGAPVHHVVMRAHDERHGSVPAPRIALSRADRFAPRSQADRWSDTLATAVPAAAPQPAAIRALAFAAALGPVRGPCSAPVAPDVVIDLAGEEALIEYLSQLAPVPVSD